MANLINKSDYPDEEWMTSDEVIQFFKISRSTLNRWNANKFLARVIIGGISYYPKKLTQKLMLHNLELPNGITNTQLLDHPTDTEQFGEAKNCNDTNNKAGTGQDTEATT